MSRIPIPTSFLTVLCVLVAFSSSAQAQQDLPLWSLEPELRIGAIDGPEALDALGDVLVSPRTGRIFVTERSQRILVFDPQGRRLQPFGGAGEGPGEFQNLKEVFWTDGSITATDPRNYRVTAFTEEGEVVEARWVESAPVTDAGSPARPIAPMGSGIYIGQALDEVRHGPLLRGQRSLVRIDVDGRDSILDRSYMADGWIPVARGMLGIPLPAETVLGVHPHGSHVVLVRVPDPSGGDTDSFRIRKVARDASVVFDRSYSYAAKRRPDDYARRFVDETRDGIRALGLGAGEAERLVSRHTSPFLPPVREVQVGADGTIWLQREEESGGQVWWHVLDAQGEPQANLRLPSALRVRHVDGETLWGFETDDLGVYYLVRYRIDRSTR